MTAWTRLKDRLVALLGSDVDAVRKVEVLDQKNREIGHQLRNLEQRRDAITRLVRSMRHDDDDDESGGEDNGSDRTLIH